MAARSGQRAGPTTVAASWGRWTGRLVVLAAVRTPVRWARRLVVSTVAGRPGRPVGRRMVVMPGGWGGRPATVRVNPVID
ncbi:hypothetical protein [Actinophytocola sediminis]